GIAEEFDLAREHLGDLTLGRRGLHLAVDHDAGAGVEVLDHGLIVRQFARRDHLHIPLARAVVQLDEAEPALGVAAGADPAPEPGPPPHPLDLSGLRHRGPVPDLLPHESPTTPKTPNVKNTTSRLLL